MIDSTAIQNKKEEPICCFTRRSTTPLCCRCLQRRKASPLACLSVCFLLLAYNLLGGFLFLALEGNLLPEETAVAASKPKLDQEVNPSAVYQLRSKTVERLWSITEDLNILYKENWTKLAAKELMDFQKVLLKSARSGGREGGFSHGFDAEGYRWTFSTSFLYALTLITTIGHGEMTPKSPLGKMAAIAYSCVGIPIVLLYLSTVGGALARVCRVAYSRLRPGTLPSPPAAPCRDKYDSPFQAALNLDNFKTEHHWICRDHTRVPILLTILIMTLYIGLGSIIFHKTEKWSLLDGCFFSFSSLATIGIGDLKPGLYGSSLSSKAEDLAIGITCVYILVGIVVMAMCFNLIQEDLGASLKGCSVLCSGRTKNSVVHALESCEERS